jgi:2-dehydro-3-deoxyphosphogluconate aldolase / (4S)-4-hydroxy-2-oxoglutarate aldolase
MTRFSRIEVLNTIMETGLIPVFYHQDIEVAKKIVAACVAGGARVAEFTNRGDFAPQVFQKLAEHASKIDPKVMLGVGSIVDAPTSALYIASGASFVVGPNLNPDVARLCNRRKISYSPGCGSASEIAEAEELGVEIVKVFPGDSVGGPEFVKSILGPCPWTRIMPTGGVSDTRESISSWFKAGVAAVGIGGNLIKKEWLETGNFDAISERTAKVLAWIREVRGRSPIAGIEHVALYPYGGATAQSLAEWYGKVFGFKIQDGNASIMLEASGPGRIELMKEGETDRCHIAVRVFDMDETASMLKGNGIELEEPKIGPDFKAVFLRQTDPAGNRVHLLWRRP